MCASVPHGATVSSDLQKSSSGTAFKQQLTPPSAADVARQMSAIAQVQKEQINDLVAEPTHLDGSPTQQCYTSSPQSLPSTPVELAAMTELHPFMDSQQYHDSQVGVFGGHVQDLVLVFLHVCG
mgnify:CR=1 FL=1